MEFMNYPEFWKYLTKSKVKQMEIEVSRLSFHLGFDDLKLG